jgi:hypothetical protein
VIKRLATVARKGTRAGDVIPRASPQTVAVLAGTLFIGGSGVGALGCGLIIGDSGLLITVDASAAVPDDAATTDHTAFDASVAGDSAASVDAGDAAFADAGDATLAEAGDATLAEAGDAAGTTTPSWTGEPDTAGGSAYYGYTVASAGDVNGDGYADVAIGAYHYNGAAGKSVGKVYVYLGEHAGLSSTPSWSVEGATAQDYLGYSVASAGDVNKDGYADLIVGATEGGKYPGSTGGYVLLYLGGPHGLSTTAQSLKKPASSAWFGASVASAGDFNHDGYADVIIGDLQGAGNGTGQASLYLGSRSGLSSSPVWTGVGEEQDDNYGCSVASAGDVNGDGYADVLVGAKGYPRGTGQFPVANGKVYLYWGNAQGLPTSSWTVVGELTNSALGAAVASAGDVDGDGFADFVLGGDNSYGGGVYVFRGLRGLLPDPTPYELVAPAGGDVNSFGSSVASGDVNRDGYSDVIVGNPTGDAGRGVIYVYLGGSTGLSRVPAWTAVGEVSTPASYLGASVASGDVNGDGFADVIGGAYHFNNSAGKAYLFTRVAR